MNTFIDAMKHAMLETVNAAKPFAFTFGKVIGASPLKIQVDQKLILGDAQLILTNAVREHTVEITPSGGERKRHTLHYGLKTGENVLLLRCDGGQRFIVLDRVEALK